MKLLRVSPELCLFAHSLLFCCQWLALPFDARDKKEELSEMFSIEGIPSLIVLDAKTGAVISKDGRTDVMKSKAGVADQWLKACK